MKWSDFADKTFSFATKEEKDLLKTLFREFNVSNYEILSYPEKTDNSKLGGNGDLAGNRSKMPKAKRRHPSSILGV